MIGRTCRTCQNKQSVDAFCGNSLTCRYCEKEKASPLKVKTHIELKDGPNSAFGIPVPRENLIRSGGRTELQAKEAIRILSNNPGMDLPVSLNGENVNSIISRWTSHLRRNPQCKLHIYRLNKTIFLRLLN